MYGIETIQSLNRKNAEAEAILAKHVAGCAEIAKHGTSAGHTPTRFAPTEKIAEILEVAKG